MSQTDKTIVLPLLPLRDVVVFPTMVIPLFVGRDKSIAALDAAMAEDKRILLVAQRDGATDEPTAEALYDVGTVASILQLLKLPDGTVKVLVEGITRANVDEVSTDNGYYTGEVIAYSGESAVTDEHADLVKTLVDQFESYVNASKKIPAEVMSSINGIEDLSRITDTIAAHMNAKVDIKQSVLELVDVAERARHVMDLIDNEIDLLQVEKRVRGRVKKQMEKSQREYYLNEQIKAIQKELGDLDDGPNEIEQLEQKIADAGMPEEALEKTRSELNKLKQMSPMSAEASVVRSYIDWMLGVPWQNKSRVKLDLKRAKEILDKDHYGLEDVKDRVLEYLAVQKRVKKVNGPVLCLVGPPGVGKTSLGESIAKATNRKFVRMALGGVRDEAEIRGHRRTYIGSMPGKILQKVSKVGVRNPLFLLDEIDKMGMDHRGDPASALLEVLDPEQNKAFNDHYLEVDYDLSDVVFICTANSMNLPAPLLDRMEVIRIPGYTEEEKLNIAQQYLIPKQSKKNGLKAKELSIPEASIRRVIREYTREAGVRSLEREISKLCRKAIKDTALGVRKLPIDVDDTLTEEYLGVPPFQYGIADEENRVGQVTGLAWTQVGGELLTIESVSVVGKGRNVKTGSLGDVMQESIQAAFTVVRSRSQSYGVPAVYHERHDLHVHVPEGATPKDGPSAGIAMCTSLVSVMTKIPVRADVAMTGEITLRGEVLKIGGLKEKLLAAHRGGIKTVVIPHDNAADLREVPDNVKADLEIIPVRWLDDVLDVALVSKPEPISDEAYLLGMFDSAKNDANDAAGNVRPH